MSGAFAIKTALPSGVGCDHVGNAYLLWKSGRRLTPRLNADGHDRSPGDNLVQVYERELFRLGPAHVSEPRSKGDLIGAFDDRPRSDDFIS